MAVPVLIKELAVHQQGAADRSPDHQREAIARQVDLVLVDPAARREQTGVVQR